jgi:uncharacterized protein (DUF983 family)
MEGQKQLPEEMASNKQPYIMCPSCFKGGIKFNFATNVGSCDHCGTQFTKNGDSVRFM